MFRSNSERVRFVDSEGDDDDEEKVASAFSGGGRKPTTNDESSSEGSSEESEEDGEESGSGSGSEEEDEENNNDDDDDEDDNPFADPSPAAAAAAPTESGAAPKNKRGSRFNPWAKRRARKNKDQENDEDDDDGQFHDEHRVSRKSKTTRSATVVLDPAIVAEQGKLRCWLYGCGVLLCGLIIMVVLLVLLLGKKEPDPTPAPTVAPTIALPEYITNYPLYHRIANRMKDEGFSIFDEGSPQQLAYLWLQNNDTLTNPPQQRRALAATAPIPVERQIQRFRLVAFYEATNGNNWKIKTKWKSGKDSECTWHGVSCHDASSLVVGLVLLQNGVAGPLIPELGQLSTLDTLVIHNAGTNSQLTGDLNLLQTLPLLEKIQITGGNFSTPSINYDFLFTDWTRVSFIDLSQNSWKGRIPSSMQYLKKTIYLDLSHNQLTGTIPFDDIHRLPALRTLNVAYNKLTKTLPRALFTGTLTALHSLNVSYNSFTGYLPNMNDAISPTTPMASMAYQVLDFSHNEFSGPIPLTMFGVLGNLELLWINNNKLTGSLPAMTGMNSIKNIDVSNNPALIGNVPQQPVCKRIQNGLSGSTGGFAAIADCSGITATCQPTVDLCCTCCTCNAEPSQP